MQHMHLILPNLTSGKIFISIQLMGRGGKETSEGFVLYRLGGKKIVVIDLSRTVDPNAKPPNESTVADIVEEARGKRVTPPASVYTRGGRRRHT